MKRMICCSIDYVNNNRFLNEEEFNKVCKMIEKSINTDEVTIDSIIITPDAFGHVIVTTKDGQKLKVIYEVNKKQVSYLYTDVCSSSVCGSDEEDDFELEDAYQQYSSGPTAINGKQGKLPTVFRLVDFPEGSVVLDYGGGDDKSEAVAQNYLDQFDCTEVIYDKYNRSAEQNREAVRQCRENGGADLAVCSNLLNVIQEYDARHAALKNIYNLLKSDGVAYITVYEGDKKQREAGGRPTGTDSYQNFRTTADYVEEVEEVFSSVTRKGKLIIAYK